MNNNEIAQIRTELLAWAGLHRGKAISEEAMPRFHEIIDKAWPGEATEYDDLVRFTDDRIIEVNFTTNAGKMYKGYAHYVGNAKDTK
jgi:hypothetical protein